jgi:hypothetical protein
MAISSFRICNNVPPRQYFRVKFWKVLEPNQSKGTPLVRKLKNGHRGLSPCSFFLGPFE